MWGQLSPFVINCHCFVLPGVCSPLSPGGGKAGQKDSATALPLSSETGLGGGVDKTKETASRESQGVEIVTERETPLGE